MMLHPKFGRITPVEQGIALLYDERDLIGMLERGEVERPRGEWPSWKRQAPGRQAVWLQHSSFHSESYADRLPKTHDALVTHAERFGQEVGRVAAAGIHTLPRSTFVVERDPGANSTAGIYTAVPAYGSGRLLEDALQSADWGHLDVQRIGLHVAASLVRYYVPRSGPMAGDIELPIQYAEDGTLYDYNPWLVGRYNISYAAPRRQHRDNALASVSDWAGESLADTPERAKLLATISMLRDRRTKTERAIVKALWQEIWHNRPGVDWTPLGQAE